MIFGFGRTNITTMFSLPNVPKSSELTDLAFRKGRMAASSIKSGHKPKSKEARERIAEEERIRVISKVVCSTLEKITKNFPRYELMPKFYQKLLDIKIDRNRYKKSLGALKWCAGNVRDLGNEKASEIRRTRNMNAGKAFMGRVSSILRQVEGDLENLRIMKGIIENFPIFGDMPTLVVAGYANVGKSTFMKTLTGSKVKVANYPFTTQDIMIGHKMLKYTKYQIIDSPGLLDRPLEKRNKVELQAILALEELAGKVLFIFDPTQEIEPQISLYNEIKKMLRAEIFFVINKKDIAEKDKLAEIMEKLKAPDIMEISANSGDDCEKVFVKIFGLK